MNIYYTTIPQYIESRTTLVEKIAAYDVIISGMQSALLEATVSGHLSEYEMDDGQMKVRARYRNIDEMQRAMTGLEKLRQNFVNKVNGRGSVLRSGNL
jgi:hypothetical protein